MKRHFVAKSKWRFLAQFWLEDWQKGGWRQWAYTLLTMTTIIGFVYCNYLINNWIGDFFALLQGYSQALFYQSLLHVLLLMTVVTLCFCVMYWAIGRLSIKLRTYLSERINDYDQHGFLSAKLQYLTFTDENNDNQCKYDNPGQRKTNDIAKICVALEKLPYWISSFFNAIMYGVIVYQLTPIASNSFMGFELLVKKPLFVCLCLYCALVVAVMAWVNIRYAKTYKEAVENNQDLTDLAVNNYKNSAIIAQTKGLGEDAKNKFSTEFGLLKNTLCSLLNSFVTMQGASGVLALIVSLLPWMATGYLYFHHIIVLAVMMQISIAFADCIGNFLRFTDDFLNIAKLGTHLRRVHELDKGLQHLKDIQNEFIDYTLEVDPDADYAVQFSNVKVITKGIGDDKLKPVFKIISTVTAGGSNNVMIEIGSRVHLVGANGSGKTTLIKMLSGVYPYGKGKIKLREKPYVVTQNLVGVGRDIYEYLGVGNLKQVTDELKASKRLLGKFKTFCKDKGYGHVREKASQMGKDFISTLSGGEQKLMAIVRAICKLSSKIRPFVVLDETDAGSDQRSSVPEAGENFTKCILAEELAHCLPDSTIILVTHQKVPDIFNQSIELL